MSQPKISLLSENDLENIHNATLKILRDVGVFMHNKKILGLLDDLGAIVDHKNSIICFPEKIVAESIQRSTKQYILYGRDKQRIARYGYGDKNLMSSPGQFGWFDYKENGKKRDPVLEDAHDAAIVGDALENVTVVGAMAVPEDVPQEIRDVVLTAELIKNTTKPIRCWPISPDSSRYVLEILKTVAGGEKELRKNPMTEMFLEPISPLQLPDLEVEILKEYLKCGQPASLGPMAMASGTAPTTLAGVLAQENAEILAGIVVIQALEPGTPILYGGIPHIMDPRTSICAFGSPEQSLMALAMSELGQYYGFPIYLNVNLTDSKVLDIQAGMEKMSGLVLGMIKGVDLLGHAGIVGTDHGANLNWLVADNEAYKYAERICNGFDVSEEMLATEVINEIGPMGNFLTHEHTAKHFRKEFWIPDQVWTRQTYNSWVEEGECDMETRITHITTKIINSHQPDPIEEKLAIEIDRIVEVAYRELVNS